MKYYIFGAILLFFLLYTYTPKVIYTKSTYRVLCKNSFDFGPIDPTMLVMPNHPYKYKGFLLRDKVDERLITYFCTKSGLPLDKESSEKILESARKNTLPQIEINYIIYISDAVVH